MRQEKRFPKSLRILLAAIALAAGTEAAMAVEASAAATRPPNIILILADDLGYECIGANGGESYKTPVLDQLAKSGVRFEHCYSQPLCTPSRVQIMTGIYNVRNYVGWARLDASQTTFANLLKKAGYATCMAGKWQLGIDHQIGEDLKRFGFDESYLHPHGRYYWGASVVANGERKELKPQEYGPDAIQEHALDFIERSKTKPFFLYYPVFLPHDPWLPTPDSGVPDAWTLGSEHRKSNARYFADNIQYLDKLIGQMAAKLEELGLRDNTLILFTGDNGTGWGIRTMMNTKTVMGGKGLMTDAGTRVPLIVNWPAGIRKGGVCKDLVDTTDFLPTFCALAGVEIPANLKIDGHSFLPQLRGEPGNPRQWCYSWFTKYPTQAAPREWARNQRYKLYRTGEFYDVSQDFEEKHPLTSLSPEAEAARKLLLQALDQYRDARPAEMLALDKNGKNSKGKESKAGE